MVDCQKQSNSSEVTSVSSHSEEWVTFLNGLLRLSFQVYNSIHPSGKSKIIIKKSGTAVLE